MLRKPLRKPSDSVYADFGFTPWEVFACTFCGISEQRTLIDSGCSLIAHAVPITRRCPVSGLVGVCVACHHTLQGQNHTTGEPQLIRPEVFGGCWFRLNPWDDDERTWTPPAMAQVSKGEPLYVLLRGFADDDRLRQLVQEVWDRIPNLDRQAMRKHLKMTEEGHTALDKGALRIEALPNWPGRGQAIGQCLNRGRAIRLHSPAVNAMDDDVARSVLAHELAHAYQYATNRRSLRRKFQQKHIVPGAGSVDRKQLVEEDAIESMGRWGFKQQEIWHWFQRRREELEEAQEKKWEQTLERWAAEAASKD